METLERPELTPRRRLRKPERRQQILLELRLRPHVRITELAERFGVSSETVRRDMDALSDDGLISRAHGGASPPAPGHYPDLDERSRARQAERARIGRAAAGLVRPGDTVMIDSGSTTHQLARFLAYQGTRCTVLTNSLSVATILGQNAAARVILCPGEFLASEAAVIGTETVDFLARHNVDRCLIGASGLTVDGPSESVRGFAAVKRAMLERSVARHLLVDSEKFGATGLSRVTGLGEIGSLITDAPPGGNLAAALDVAGVEVMVAGRGATDE